MNSEQLVLPGLHATRFVREETSKDHTHHDLILTTAKTFLMALCITLVQLGVYFTVGTGGDDLGERYYRLRQWDTAWYSWIADNGYVLETLPLNSPENTLLQIGFFPGYPLTVWLVKKMTGLAVDPALLLTAEAFAVGTWMYVLLFLKRYQVRKGLYLPVLFAIAAYPSANYLIAAYSESMFCFSLLGFIYWISDPRPKSWISASIHGFLVGATRIVGVPLLVLPILWHFLSVRKIPTRIQPYTIAIYTVAGAAMFFSFCYSAFGEWNAYSQAQKLAMDVHPSAEKALMLSSYIPNYPVQTPEGYIDPDDVSRWSVVFILAFGVTLFFSELALWYRRKTTGRKIRIMLYAATLFMFVIASMGLAPKRMISMMRYTFPMYLCLVLATAMLVSQISWRRVLSVRLAWISYSILIGFFCIISAQMIDMYSMGRWVS